MVYLWVLYARLIIRSLSPYFYSTRTIQPWLETDLETTLEKFKLRLPTHYFVFLISKSVENPWKCDCWCFFPFHSNFQQEKSRYLKLRTNEKRLRGETKMAPMTSWCHPDRSVRRVVEKQEKKERKNPKKTSAAFVTAAAGRENQRKLRQRCRVVSHWPPFRRVAANQNWLYAAHFSTRKVPSKKTVRSDRIFFLLKFLVYSYGFQSFPLTRLNKDNPKFLNFWSHRSVATRSREKFGKKKLKSIEFTDNSI